jgi:hypothetical protein
MSTTTVEQHDWFDVLKLRQVWASLAISMIWLAVMFSSIYSQTIVSNYGQSTVPSGVVVAFFATIATWIVARYGLKER